METHKPIRRMETHKPIFGPPLTDAFVALSAVPPPPCPQKPMLLTAEVNPPGHGVRHPPAEAYLKRLGRPNLFLLAAPSLDGDWRPWAALLTAPPGAPLRMRHRGRSPPAERPEQACKEKPPVALCITPPGRGRSLLQTQAYSRPTTSFGSMTATLLNLLFSIIITIFIICKCRL